MKILSIIPFLLLAACGGGFHHIDEEVRVLMQETSSEMNGDAPPHRSLEVDLENEDLYTEWPTTNNPLSSDLTFSPAEPLNINVVESSLDQAAKKLDEESETLSLHGALTWANSNAKEMQFAQYDYIYTTLALVSEFHEWNPRVSYGIDTAINADSTGGMYDTSLSVVNDFSVEKKFQYGGSISASLLTTIAERLHNAASTTNNIDSDLSVALKLPLLKGSGAVAKESLIQAQRNMVYAARTYERFRRSFYKDVVSDYLSLVVQKQALENAQRSVDSLRQVAERQKALYESGRARLYDSADAENQALGAVANLSQSWERYRLAIDRFKIRIGWPIDKPIQIETASIGVVPPHVNVQEAVGHALEFRLDLQTEYDQLVDRSRAIENALNALLPDVTLSLSTTLESDSDRPLSFDEKGFDYLAGLSVDIPFDQHSEEVAVRQAQINLLKAKRSFREARDRVVISVRSALRNIEVYQFSYDLQERNVGIAQLGLDSINADPDRVSVLDQTRAIQDLQSAQNARDSARRDLELSIVDYLLQAGQLRITGVGGLQLPLSENNLTIEE